MIVIIDGKDTLSLKPSGSNMDTAMFLIYTKKINYLVLGSTLKELNTNCCWKGNLLQYHQCIFLNWKI